MHGSIHVWWCQFGLHRLVWWCDKDFHIYFGCSPLYLFFYIRHSHEKLMKNDDKRERNVLTKVLKGHVKYSCCKTMMNTKKTQTKMLTVKCIRMSSDLKQFTFKMIMEELLTVKWSGICATLPFTSITWLK